MVLPALPVTILAMLTITATTVTITATVVVTFQRSTYNAADPVSTWLVIGEANRWIRRGRPPPV